jgi:TatD DNase family protein
MILVDTHAHLDEIKNIDEALARGRDAGIRAIVGVGMDGPSNEKILTLAQTYPGYVFPAIGLHPWRLEKDDGSTNFALIEKELPRCLALGEVGLDFALETAREKQIAILGRLLSIAARYKKPVLLHGRRAWAEALALLKTYKIERAVFHWYSGPLDVLDRILEAGYYISATPAAAYSDKHRQAIQRAPRPRLLLETDAPEEYRGKASEPKDLLTTVQAVSALWPENLEGVARQTFRNSQEFFGASFPPGNE